MHLDFHRDDPLLVKWHQLAGVGDVEAIRVHYGDLFDRSEIAFSEAKKKDPKTKKLEDPILEAARSALSDVSGFLAVPSKEAFAFDQPALADYYRLMDEARAFESGATDETAAMGVGDGDTGSHVAHTHPRQLQESRRESQT